MCVCMYIPRRSQLVAAARVVAREGGGIETQL